MQILKQDKKEGIIRLKVENSDDLWILSRIVDKNDSVKGITTRAIKQTESQKEKRVKITVLLDVEKIEFEKNRLRLLGVIKESSNSDIPQGVFQPITVELNDILTIKKDEWKKWQIERIKDAVESTKKPKLILCAADYGNATIALLKEFGIDYLTDLSKSLPGKKKEMEKLYQKSRDDYLEELAKILEEISKNKNVDKIAFGGVGFLTENFTKTLEKFPKLKNKISLFKISAHGKNGINELIKRGAVEKIIKGGRITKETQLVEKFFEEVSKENLATYGINEVKKAVEYGAVETLLVSDAYIQKLRENDSFEKLNQLMESAEKNGAKVMIISEEHESGERFSDMQVGALLRFKI